MRERVRAGKGTLGLVGLAVAVTFVLLTAASPHAVVAAKSQVSPAIDGIGMQPRFVGPEQAHPSTDLFSCQSSPIDGSAGPRCYSPQQIQQAYGYSGLLASGVNGQGVTIVIVDAYSNPYVASDLAIQSSTFGLPAASFQAVAPQGVPPFNPGDSNMDSWAEEITLDVLWAHAMAPAARIVLVEAKSSADSDILAATKWAVDNNVGNVISQSFGEAETCVDPSILNEEHAVFQEAVNKGMTLFASAGDSGASQYACSGNSPILAVSSPASDTLVTGVGGTTLNASDPTGSYLGETAWTEPLFGCNPPAENDINCSGGGYSTIFGTPSYQSGFVSGSFRGVPDVSYDAGVNGGVLTHCGICLLLSGYSPSDPTLFVLFGGTSAGSPQWAALTADAVQMAGHSFGNINPLLYALAAQPATYAADFHDVTTGTNVVSSLGGEGYGAGTGWDPVTGLGTPDAANLLPQLAVPVSTSAPAVSGVAAVNQVLTTATGTWTGAVTGYAYQWQECATDGTGCTDIPGATSASYQLQAAQAGHTIRSEVVASNAWGPSLAAASPPTAVVVPMPSASTSPTVSGKTVVGKKLRADNGTWNTAATFTYQWLRCRPNGSRCKTIADATSTTYRLTAADRGHTIRAQVSATNAAGTTAVSSARTALVVGVPVLKKKPRVSGIPTVNHVLTARKGIWSGPPTKYRYQWLRCDVNGSACQRINGARYVRYRVRSSDVGHRLRVRVIALNAAGKAKAISDPTRVVQ